MSDAERDTAFRWVCRVADLYLEHGEEVSEVLVAEGCDPELADIIPTDLQSATAWNVVAEVGASIVEEFDQRLTNGKSVVCRWSEQPSFMAARRWLDGPGLDQRYRETRKRLFADSAEGEALSKALDDIGEEGLAGAALASARVGQLRPSSPWLRPVKRGWWPF